MTRCAPCSVVPWVSTWNLPVVRQRHAIDAEVAALGRRVARHSCASPTTAAGSIARHIRNRRPAGAARACRTNTSPARRRSAPAAPRSRRVQLAQRPRTHASPITGIQVLHDTLRPVGNTCRRDRAAAPAAHRQHAGGADQPRLLASRPLSFRSNDKAPGRQAMVSASRIGYSSTSLKSCGIDGPAASPPSTPPNEAFHKSELGQMRGGRTLLVERAVGDQRRQEERSDAGQGPDRTGCRAASATAAATPGRARRDGTRAATGSASATASGRPT